MVSLQAPVSPNSRKANSELGILSKKRKFEEFVGEENLDKRSKAESTKSIFDFGLHLESPLPLEWERCLDIQSGEIHFYNTITQKRTSGDPRASTESPNAPAGHMSLDLELNLLPCDSQRKDQTNKHNSAGPPLPQGDLSVDIGRQQKKKSSDLTRCPSWLAFEGDQQEMVATACMRCHMLVMLCKSSPTCPNCKFVHPPDQSPPKLFKQRLSVLW